MNDFLFTDLSGADGGEAEEVKARPRVVFGLARVFAKELYDAKLLSEEGWRRVGSRK